MTDLKLAYDAAAQRYDLAFDAAGQPAVEIGLKTAAIAAVLSWGRAREGDPLPGFDGDRKGHWADPWADGGRKGSRIWLLNGRIVTQRTIADAKAYLEEALMPMVAKGLLRGVVVSTWRSAPTRIAGSAILVHLDGATETVEFEDLVSA
ncbi:MAG: phage GP46 family protein [Rhodospirillales bacterium]|nr:phage GP46 family protein [Rhodospirillales bacterium]